MRVQNIRSNKSNAIANQFEIFDNGKIYFQSYSTIIAVIEDGEVTLDHDSWDCSRTTGKYRNIFLDEDIAGTRRKIKSGEYKLANLN